MTVIDPTTGRWISTMTEMERYLSKIDTSGGPDACWPWTGGVFENGYARFSLSDERRTSVRAHRWGYIHIVGPIPKGLVVCHSCDFPICQNPQCWFLGTNAVNSADMVAKGRSAKGTRNAASKLTERQVKEIRTLLERTATGRGKRGEITLAEIATRFGITNQAVWRIKHGLGWNHVR